MPKILKNIVRKLIYNYKASSKSYIDYLRKQGVKVGGDMYL